MYLLTLANTYCLQSTEVCRLHVEWYGHVEASSIE